MILNNSWLLRPVNCYDCEQCFLSGIWDGNIFVRSGESYTGFFYSLSILGIYPVRIFAQCCTTALTTTCNRWCGSILRNKAVHCFMEKLPPNTGDSDGNKGRCCFRKYLHGESRNRVIKKERNKAYRLKKIYRRHLLSLEYRKRTNNTLHWTSQ